MKKSLSSKVNKNHLVKKQVSAFKTVKTKKAQKAIPLILIPLWRKQVFAGSKLFLLDANKLKF